MRRTALIATLAVGLLVLFAVPALGFSSAAETHAQDGQDELHENATAPGERLSGVVGVQEAELEGDLDQRTFGIQIAQAASEGAQADAVGDQLTAIEERLSDLEERKAELEEKREAGEISEGQYRAGMAAVAASTESAMQLTNQTEDAAGELPRELLEEKGINVDAIQTLKDKAHELSGPEVAEIARDIAGPGVGETPAGDRIVGPPDHADGDGGPPHDDDDRPGQGGPPADDDSGSDDTDDEPGSDDADDEPDDSDE